MRQTQACVCSITSKERVELQNGRRHSLTLGVCISRPHQVALDAECGLWRSCYMQYLSPQTRHAFFNTMCALKDMERGVDNAHGGDEQPPAKRSSRQQPRLSEVGLKCLFGSLFGDILNALTPFAIGGAGLS